MSRLNPEATLSYAGQRRKMVEEQLGDRGIKDLRLLQVMSRVPRHLFTLDSLQHRAYGGHAITNWRKPDDFPTLYCCKHDSRSSVKGE